MTDTIRPEALLNAQDIFQDKADYKTCIDAGVCPFCGGHLVYEESARECWQTEDEYYIVNCSYLERAIHYKGY